jgi:hypothetical protein
MGALPNVLIIGSMKCGTSSLHHYLDSHPDVQMSANKEVNFFWRQTAWEKGRDWYRGWFDGSVPIRGESSVNYTKDPKAARVCARRMRKVVPDAKLIYLVRDPVERSISHYLHTHAKGNEHRPASKALLDLRSEFVSRSMFYANVEPYLEDFDPLVLRQEDLLDHQEETLSAIASFLDLASPIPHSSEMWETADSKGQEKPVLKRRVRERLADHFARDQERLAALVTSVGLAGET